MNNPASINESKLVSKYRYCRNLLVTAIASDSINTIAGCSNGIEPLSRLIYSRSFSQENNFVEVNPIFEEIARKRSFYSNELIHEISKQGSIQNIRHIPQDVKKIVLTTLDIKPELHLRMQVAFQKFVDGGVSKIITLPENATKKDIRDLYLLSYKLGCNGINIFRYGCNNRK